MEGYEDDGEDDDTSHQDAHQLGLRLLTYFIFKKKVGKRMKRYKIGIGTCCVIIFYHTVKFSANPMCRCIVYCIVILI